MSNNCKRINFITYILNGVYIFLGIYFSLNDSDQYKKPKKSKFNSELITILSKHFKVSKREIKDSYHLIGKDYSKIILQNNSIDDKQIKKLLK